MKLHLPNAAGLLLACLLLAPATDAADKAKAPPDPMQDPVMRSAGFLSSHPDLRFRLLALEKRKANEPEEAFKFFQRAAFYADKPSQAMVAEMLWDGVGTPRDRPLAYAWMDLAAERNYALFVEARERYWQQLDEAERTRAIEAGQDIYARYGDEAAQPRIANTLRRARMTVTGSRTGFTGNLRIIVPGPLGDEAIDGSKFYDERYWDPAKYQAWHDAVWMNPRVGTVAVGEAKQVPGEAAESRIPKTEPLPDAAEPETEDAMPKLETEQHKH